MGGVNMAKQEFKYEIVEDGAVRKARVQSAGDVSLDREGSDEEIIKNYIASTLNVRAEDVELKKSDSATSDVITSASTDSKDSDPIEDVKRKNRK